MIKRLRKYAKGGYMDDSGGIPNQDAMNPESDNGFTAIKNLGNFSGTNPSNPSIPLRSPVPKVPMNSIMDAWGMATAGNGAAAKVPMYNTSQGSLMPKISGLPNTNTTSVDAKPSLIGRLSDGLDRVTPYISNIVNAFRTPPEPSRPVLDPTVTLAKSNLTGERNQSLNDEHSYDTSVNRNVQGNTGEALKLYNKGRGFAERSSINQRENENNIGINNMQARLDSDVNVRNTDKENDYLDSKTARSIAQQRTQAENVANAGDKAVEIRNEHEKARVNLATANVLASTFKNSGVLDRARAYMKKQKLDDPLGKDYKDLDDNGNSTIKAMGGRIKRRIPSQQMMA